MSVNKLTFTAEGRTERQPFWLMRFLLVTVVIILGTTAGFAGANGNRSSGPHGNLVPDLATFPVNSDGTVDVIIQFKDTLQAKHFQMMASQGGRLKYKFEQI